jgi:hypothetical protein
MGHIDDLKSWYRQGHWFDTPQGICMALSLPICWIAALVAFFLPIATRPLYLSAGPLAFLMTPILAFAVFVRFGMGQSPQKQFSSSLLTTAMVLVAIGFPFYAPYIRSYA